MNVALSRIPWFVAAPAFVAVTAILALTTNYFGGDYFKRTFLEEANPLVTDSPSPTPTADTPAPTMVAIMTTPTAPPVESPTPAGPVTVSSGEFRNGAPGHFGSGTASLGRDAAGNAVLVLADFSVTNGPDLHVILGDSEDGGGDGLDLGPLKATDGTFSYEVSADADLESFRSVTIFCKSFPTIFAVATLGDS